MAPLRQGCKVGSCEVFQAEGTPGRKVCYQEGKWPIKATANSISGTGGTDLVEKEKEK